MKPKLLLRIASIVMFLHDIGHTFGHLSWKEAVEPEKQEVIRQMTENKCPFMGATRSMGDYYDGYGYASTLALLLIAVILWIASGLEPQNIALTRKMLIVIAVVLLAWGIVELTFFFPFAAAFSLVAAVLTGIALLRFAPGNK
jgi:hypothetical protein